MASVLTVAAGLPAFRYPFNVRGLLLLGADQILMGGLDNGGASDVRSHIGIDLIGNGVADWSWDRHVDFVRNGFADLLSDTLVDFVGDGVRRGATRDDGGIDYVGGGDAGDVRIVDLFLDHDVLVWISFLAGPGLGRKQKSVRRDAKRSLSEKATSRSGPLIILMRGSKILRSTVTSMGACRVD